MKIIIAEDELLISEMLKEMVLELGHEVLGQAMDFEESVELIELHPDVDILFCDINFNSEKTGIDLGEQLHKKYKRPFIYLTSYSDNNTLEAAANTCPSAYLVKPFNKSDIKATLVMAAVARKKSDQFTLIKDGHDQVKIWLNDIDFIESDNNYITIRTETDKYVVRNSLENFIQGFNSDHLVRVHRSFAVNLSKVKAISGTFLILNKTKIPVSRKYKESIYILFSNLIV